MRLTGHCYCGHVRYQAEGDPVMKAQCYCRECQYVTGGGPNNFIAMPAGSHTYVAGAPKAFTRTDIANAVTREFCPECGAHVLSRLPNLPVVIVKVGTLDDPAAFAPEIAIYVADKQPYHHIPEHLTQFPGLPPM